MKVLANNKELKIEEAKKVLKAIEEADVLMSQKQELEKKLKEIKRKLSIQESRMLQEVSDMEIAENSGVVEIKVYSAMGSLIDSRKVELEENMKPKNLGVSGIKSMLSDLIQWEGAVIKSAVLFEWFENNGYIPPIKQEDVKENLTSNELTTILGATVEKTARVKTKRTDTISGNLLNEPEKSTSRTNRKEKEIKVVDI